MKKTIYFLFVLSLFACKKDEPKKNSSSQLSCKTIKAELIEDGHIRSEYNTYDTNNQLLQKCISWDGVHRGCVSTLIDISTSFKTVYYLFTYSSNNQTDTLAKAIYQNSRIISYAYDYDNGSPYFHNYFKYDSISNKLIEFRKESPPNKQIYSVETDSNGDPIKLTLTSRNTNSVYDEMDIEITYDNSINPLKNDLLTQNFLFVFPEKSANYVKSVNAENNTTSLYNQSDLNSNKYPTKSVLKDESGDTVLIRKFTYDCF